MFFNADIFFRSGPLALVWLAGNDNFKTKKGRNSKSYVSILKVDMTVLCTAIRNLFPQMGTADGIPLKKMAALAKGLGVIYHIKIEEFAREVFQASLSLKRPVTLVEITNDQPTRLKGKAKKRALDVAEQDEQEHVWVNEGEPIDAFGPFPYDGDLPGGDFPTPRGVERAWATVRASEEAEINRLERTEYEENVDQLSPPRRRRRRDDVEDSNVLLGRLTTTAADPRAHLLLEEEEPLLDRPDPDFERDLDFGNGEELLQDVFLAPPEPADDAAMEPPANMEEGMGELENISKEFETPKGAGTQPENRRRHRNDSQRDPDETVMELEDIQGERERPARRARRRLQLLVDVTTTISLKDLLDRNDQMKAGLDMTALKKRLDETRAPPKSIWNMDARKRMSPLDFITSAGRSGGRVLTEMTKKVGPVQERQKRRARVEEGRRRVEETSIAGISVTAARAGGTINGEPEISGGEDIAVGKSTVAPAPEELPPPAPYEPEEGMGGYFDQQQQQPELQQEQPDQQEEAAADPFAVPQDRRRKNGNRRDEQAAISGVLDEGKSFEDLFPVDVCKKKKAARGFMLLLKMQAKKSVAMTQEDSFGEIMVEKTVS